MKYYKNTIYISILALTISVGVTFAQTTTSSSSAIEIPESVEVSLPMEKGEFLLYYGLTENEAVNIEIGTLRKDFIQKMEELKTEYQKSFEKATQNENLVLPSSTQVKEVETKTETEKPVATRSEVSKKAVDTKPVQSKTTTAKVTLIDKKEILMAPILNITNNKTPYTENSSWFQKIKSLFKW